MQQAFNILLIVMAVLAVVVFIALFFVDAGYGMLLNRKWGKTVSNKVGWFARLPADDRAVADVGQAF